MNALKREKASMRPIVSATQLLTRAKSTFEEIEKSYAMTSNAKREYPSFDESEVTIGAVLGVGGFGVVSEVKSFQISTKHEEADASLKEGPKTAEDQDHDNDDHYELDTAKEKMTRRCLRYGQARYAIKKLDPFLSELDRTRGMIDLTLEVTYLTVLWHPNIGETEDNF